MFNPMLGIEVLLCVRHEGRRARPPASCAPRAPATHIPHYTTGHVPSRPHSHSLTHTMTVSQGLGRAGSNHWRHAACRLRMQARRRCGARRARTRIRAGPTRNGITACSVVLLKWLTRHANGVIQLGTSKPSSIPVPRDQGELLNRATEELLLPRST